MRTLIASGEIEISLRDIVFGADKIGLKGETVHLILSPGIWSLVVEIQTVSGLTGRMKGTIEAVCPQGSLLKARRLGLRSSVEHGTDDQ